MIMGARRSLQRSPRRRLQAWRASGFTLIEMMVAIAVIGIISGITIVETGRAYNRDQINRTSLQLRSWLLEISSQPDKLGQSCTITMDTGAIAGGTRIASVQPTACSTTPNLIMPGRSNLTFNVGATQPSWTFTRRNSIDSSNDVIIKFSLNGFTALRCVKVTAISGLLRLGRNDATSDVSAGTCNNWNTI